MSKSRKKTAAILYAPEPKEREREYCHGKQCLSKAEAHSMIHGIKRRQHYLHSKVIPKRAYQCPDCGYFHLTHLPAHREYTGFDEFD